MIVNPAKVINTTQLLTELRAANILLDAIGTIGNPATNVFTYANGFAVDLPAEAAPVIVSHVAQPYVDQAVTDFSGNIDSALARLDDIVINGSTYTAAQIRDGVIDLARIQRRIIRYLRAMQPK